MAVNENLYSWILKTYKMPAAEWYRNNPTKPHTSNPHVPPSEAKYFPQASAGGSEKTYASVSPKIVEETITAPGNTDNLNISPKSNINNLITYNPNYGEYGQYSTKEDLGFSPSSVLYKKYEDTIKNIQLPYQNDPLQVGHRAMYGTSAGSGSDEGYRRVLANEAGRQARQKAFQDIYQTPLSQLKYKSYSEAPSLEEYRANLASLGIEIPLMQGESSYFVRAATADDPEVQQFGIFNVGREDYRQARINAETQKNKENLNKIEIQPELTERQDYTFDMMRADYEKENPGGNFDTYIEEELAKLSGDEYTAALEFMGRTPSKTTTSSDYLKNFEDQLLSQSKEEANAIAPGPAPGFENRAPANDFLDNYKEEKLAQLPAGPRGYEPPSEIAPERIIPIRSPGSQKMGKRPFHEIMGSLDPQTFAAYTAGLIAPPYDVQEPPRARDLSPEQNKALQEYYNQNRGSANPVPIPDWLYPGKEYLKPSENKPPDFSERVTQAPGPAPEFENRAPANDFLDNYKEEKLAQLPAGPRGYEPPSEIAPERIIPIRSPGSSLRPGEGFEIIDPFKNSPVTKPGLSQEKSVEDSRFRSAVATASKASDIQKAQGAFGSEYDPQKARAAVEAADEYRRSAKTEDPFRSAAANSDPFRSSVFG